MKFIYLYFSRRNDKSIILEVWVQDTSFILCGDATGTSFDRVQDSGAAPALGCPDCSRKVLKLAHHGAKTLGSPGDKSLRSGSNVYLNVYNRDWIEFIKPTMAFVRYAIYNYLVNALSCGRLNGHGHPNRASIDSAFRRLQNFPGTRETYYVFTDGDKYTVEGAWTRKWFLSTRPLGPFDCRGTKLEFTVTTNYPHDGWTETFTSRAYDEPCVFSGVTYNLYRN